MKRIEEKNFLLEAQKVLYSSQKLRESSFIFTLNANEEIEYNDFS